MNKRYDIHVHVFSEVDVMDDDLSKQRFLGKAVFRLERVLCMAEQREMRHLLSGGNLTLQACQLDKYREYLVRMSEEDDLKMPMALFLSSPTF